MGACPGTSKLQPKKRQVLNHLRVGGKLEVLVSRGSDTFSPHKRLQAHASTYGIGVLQSGGRIPSLPHTLVWGLEVCVLELCGREEVWDFEDEEQYLRPK
eukprot:3359783-Amphidinium_carterae.4